MRTRRLGLLGLSVLVAALAGGTLWRRARRADVPAPPSWNGAPTAAPTAVPARPAEGRPSTRPAPRADALDAFRRRVAALRLAVLSEVQHLLATKGGAGALDHIARTARGPLETDEDRLRAAFLCRLIPFVAAQHPAADAQAYALARELLAGPDLDGDVRLQALAGLAGLPSSRLTYLEVEGVPGSVGFAFMVDETVDFARSEWDHGLDAAAARDPSFAAGLPGLLAGDREPRVRELAATVLGRSGTPESTAALAGALSADPDEHVRRAGAGALAGGGASAVDPLERAARQDASDDVRAAAVASLARAAPSDPRVRALLSQAAVDDGFARLRPAVAEAAFDTGDPGLRPALTSLLLREAGRPEVVDVFVRESAARGLAEFQPLFRALTAGAGPEVRALLEEGARRLDEAPRQAALAGALREGEAALRRLWDEFNRPDASPERRAQIDAEIDRRLAELSRLRTRDR